MRAVVLHSVVPVRAEASESSEQLTQLLFAETVEILEQKPRWMRIKNDADGQTGWVDFKMITPLSDAEAAQMAKADKTARIKMPVTFALSENNGQTIPLTAGTVLPDYKDGRFSVLGVNFRVDALMVAPQPLEMNAENLMNTARFFLNIPYLWGGKNALGMDCSGFTQIIHSLFGHHLLRNASEQATQGMPVKSIQDALAGDLAFFDHHDGKISHVGLILDSSRIIHCSGRVKVEKLDECGIFSQEPHVSSTKKGGDYTHHLVSIRRY